MKNANMIAWLNRTAIVESASGKFTFHSLCNRLAPAISAASVISGGTVRSPSILFRINGTIAIISFEKITAMSVIPNNMIAGIR